MNETKIRLSPAEMELVHNASVILTKNAIVQKGMGLLGALQVKQQEWVLKERQLESEKCSPKISKGENYLGLPYLVLDYPRRFDGDAVFMIRSMFWWGNFFSITLYASGYFAEQTRDQLSAAYEQLREKEYHYCISDDPWQHHFENDNYRSLQEMTSQDFYVALRTKSFIKLGKKLSLSAWDNVPELLVEEFKFLMGLAFDKLAD